MKGRQSERVFPLLVGRGNHYGSPSKESEAPGFSGAEVSETIKADLKSTSW